MPTNEITGRATVTDQNGVVHPFSPAPSMTGKDFAAQYPPITDPSVRFLICKHTAQIYPATDYFRTRSDTLRPYYGNPFAKDDDGQVATSQVGTGVSVAIDASALADL